MSGNLSVLVPTAITTTGAVTRASTATYFDKDGVLRTAAVDEIRVSYDPADLLKAPVPLLERSATNRIRNSTMQGAVPGTPGTLPTNWVAGGLGGLSRQVVGTGVEDGIEYIDIRYFGTAAVTGKPEQFLYFEAYNTVAASAGQTWASSFFCRVVGGSTAGVASCEHYIIALDGAGQITEAQPLAFFPSANQIRINRSIATRQLDATQTQTVYSRFDLNLTDGGGVAVDITIRIGLPQLERDQVTSPIKTSGSAATRAADVPTGSGLIYSTAAESPPAAYASGTAYELNQRVSVAGTGGLRTVYRSLQAANVGHDPTASPTWWEKLGTTYQVYTAGTYSAGDRVIVPARHLVYESLFAANTAPPSDVTKWKEVGPTNPWKMFDGSATSLTSFETPLSVALTPGAANAVYVGGVDADQLTVQLKDTVGGTVIDKRTLTMENSAPADYWEYFFDPFRPQRDALLTDFIPYGAAEIDISLSNSGGTIACGLVAVGTLQTIGKTVKGSAKVRPKTYSRITTDGDGVTEIDVRAKACDMSVSAIVPLEDADWAKDLIMSLQDVPVLVSATDSAYMSGLRVLGLISGEVDYGYSKTHALISLEVKGFT